MKVRMKISAVLKKDTDAVPPGKVVDLDKADALSLIKSGAAEPFRREDVEVDEKDADDKKSGDDKNKQQ
jgi:hypothetical protein